MIRNLEKRSGADNGSPSRNSGGSDKVSSKRTILTTVEPAALLPAGVNR
ncbi:hypothetical protein NC653_032750 [Populus alba x Populus x berolinensis]|uniref:Uncharacterized protein n=1 Tax=Populus alba x Populus x berolinensis TaxID=444605 RepID=A0AAD6LSD1_9ROSI|nr:hypothetical protein NC653_032750 [Populus alba x Populus x berolinensis]